MGSLTLNGATSGAVTISPPAVAGTNTLTLPAATDTVTVNAASQTLSNKTLASPSVTGTMSSTGTISTTGTVVMGSAYTMRNLIINGAMQIWQRGTSYTLTNSYVYGSADRWESDMGGTAAGTVSQSTSVPTGFQYSIKMQRTAGATSTGNLCIAQALETSNSIQAAGQTVTLSFYAKAGANFSASSSALNCIVFTGTGTDQSITNMRNNAWSGITNVNQAVTLTTSFQRFSLTYSVGATATQLGMQFFWGGTGTAGADDAVYITGVQLEIGSTATAFEYRNYQQEFDMCLRYYELVGNGGAGSSSTNPPSQLLAYKYAVPKRTSSVTLTHLANYNVIVQSIAIYTASTTSLSNTTIGGCTTQFTTSSGFSSNGMAILYWQGTDSIGISAEL